MKFFKSEDEKKAAIGTVVFHLLLLLCFIFLGMSIPMPLPEEEGMTINFGTSESGSGNVQPQDVSEQITKPNPVQNQPSKAAAETTKGDVEENLKSQDFQETANVDSKSVKSESTSTEEAKEETRKPDLSKLYPGKKKTNATSDGNTGGTGDQGKKEGSFDSNNRTGGAFGNGSSYALGGRSLKQAPSISNNFKETGKIVVEIIVDRNGKVVSARPGVKGTTISNKTQQEQARLAAMRTKFSSNPDAPAHQKGNITFNYSVN